MQTQYGWYEIHHNLPKMRAKTIKEILIDGCLKSDVKVGINYFAVSSVCCIIFSDAQILHLQSLIQ